MAIKVDGWDELPEYVRLLVEKVRDEAYDKGFDQGKRHMASMVGDYVRNQGAY